MTVERRESAARKELEMGATMTPDSTQDAALSPASENQGPYPGYREVKRTSDPFSAEEAMCEPGVEAHACNPRIQKAEARGLHRFQTNRSYRVGPGSNWRM